MNYKSHSVAVGLLIYLITLASLLYTVYVHLNFAADGIKNVTWDDIIEAFPILFLFVAIAILSASLILIPWKPASAARLAFGASIAGWAYYIPMLCIMSLAYSPLFPFMSVTAFLDMLLPNIFLYINMRYARQMMKRQVTS